MRSCPSRALRARLRKYAPLTHSLPTGQCSTSAFFYQPATYSIDDNKFVRSTVGYFYNFTQPGSCPVLDAETQAILAQNQANVQNCAATDLEALQYGIQACREVLHFFIKIFYYAAFIGIDVIQLVSTANTNPIVQDIAYHFDQMAAEFVYFFQTLGDIFYKLIMETGKLGQWLQNLVVQVREAFSLVRRCSTSSSSSYRAHTSARMRACTPSIISSASSLPHVRCTYRLARTQPPSGRHSASSTAASTHALPHGQSIAHYTTPRPREPF